MRQLILRTALFAGVVAITACGSSTSSTGTSGDSGGGSGTSTDSTISTTVPGDVVISSPTASTATTQSIAARTKGVGKEEGSPPPEGEQAPKPGDPTGEGFAAKREAMAALIAGDGECAFTMEIPTVTEPSCYGPVVGYQGHPDAASATPPQNGSGGLPPSDVGIWDETEGTQACAAAMMNALVDKVASKVDNMVKIFASMACAGKKAGLEPPAVGETLDLTSAMGTNLSVTGLTINSATVQRLENDSDGNPVYVSTISMTMSFNGNSQTGEIVLKHIPTSADNSTYKGKIRTSMTVTTVDGCGDGMMQPGAGMMAGSILYEKASASSVVYQFNVADFCGSTAPFDSSNNIDPDDKFNSSTNPGGWVHNWNYGLFSVNPETGLGSVAYAWQAGAADGRTRVFNMSVTGGSDGTASGTAYYGFGPDIANGSAGTIDGFVCNWAGPNGAISSGTNLEGRSAANLLASGRGVNKAQKQVLARASGATEFTTTAEDSFIRYAIRNACETTTGDGFLYRAETDDATATFSNDRLADSAAVTSELVDLSTIDFTMPTAPTDL